MNKLPALGSFPQQPQQPLAGSRVDKVRVIKRSLLCYNLSWFGLIPLLGIVPAVLAIQLYRRVTWERGSEWNPAEKYALWGAIVGFCGLLLSSLLWAGVISHVWHSAWP